MARGLIWIVLLLLQLNFASSLLSTRGWRSTLCSTRLYEKKPRVPTTPDLRWEVRAVGVVESPYVEKYGTPKQATISRRDGGAQEGRLRLFPGFEDCIAELKGFDYIWVLSLMHLNKGFKTKIRPQPREGSISKPPAEVGLFCSRAPHRPNPIALSCLKVTHVDVEAGVITVLGLDLLEDTPILDIKPYIPAFDAFPDAKSGWMDCITDNPLDGRVNGYQDIYSSRGMRMMRRNERIRQQGFPGEGEGNKVREGGEIESDADLDSNIGSLSPLITKYSPGGEVVTCETTGSCRSSRLALKQELEARRVTRNPSDRGNYLDQLSPPQNKIESDTVIYPKKYNPFKR